MPKAIKYESVTIASSAAVSGTFPLFGFRISAIITPGTWTDADISFELDPNGSGTFYKVEDNSGSLVRCTGVATSAARYILPPEAADAITGELAKIVSTNTASEADLNQGADRSLVVVLIPL
ncbi:hypothetical protein LCGC14_2675950 [marine sediment metagenome]|uniref:Uncharacterized protein n=1 Tax=marine sediment metagenome TaxID=412755 RepID=A0A0F9AA98_9ZZZZ